MLSTASLASSHAVASTAVGPTNDAPLGALPSTTGHTHVGTGYTTSAGSVPSAATAVFPSAGDTPLDAVDTAGLGSTPSGAVGVSTSSAELMQEDDMGESGECVQVFLIIL